MRKRDMVKTFATSVEVMHNTDEDADDYSLGEACAIKVDMVYEDAIADVWNYKITFEYEIAGDTATLKTIKPEQESRVSDTTLRVSSLLPMVHESEGMVWVSVPEVENITTF